MIQVITELKPKKATHSANSNYTTSQDTPPKTSAMNMNSQHYFLRSYEYNHDHITFTIELQDYLGYSAHTTAATILANKAMMSRLSKKDIAIISYIANYESSRI